MVNFCAVYGCGNRGDRDKKSFYRLPAVIKREGEKTQELSRKRREKWLAHLGREIKPSNLPYTRICSDHFIAGKPSALYDSTNPDWAPTVKLGHDQIGEASSMRDLRRYQRTLARKEKKKKMDAAAALINLQDPQTESENQVSDSVISDETGTSTQTDLAAETIVSMQKELQNLKSENQKLKKELLSKQAKFDENFFSNDRDKVNYHTAVQDYQTSSPDLEHSVSPYISHHSAKCSNKVSTTDSVSHEA